MNLGAIFLFMVGCTFFVIFEGVLALIKIPSFHGKTEQAEQILSTRVFKEKEAVRTELQKYFLELEKNINTGQLCFFLAYVMVSFMLHMIAPGSSMWQAFAVVLVFYLGPLAGITLAFKDVRDLKEQTLEKLS